MSDQSPLRSTTAAIIGAYVERNSVPAADLPNLIHAVHAALSRLGSPGGSAAPAAEVQKPAISPRKSVTPDYIVCLEDGRHMKSMKRHLLSDHGLTPQQYREKWGLAADYPMVAPSYAKVRSDMAKKIGLGARGRGAGAKPKARKGRA